MVSLYTYCIFKCHCFHHLLFTLSVRKGFYLVATGWLNRSLNITKMKSRLVYDSHAFRAQAGAAAHHARAHGWVLHLGSQGSTRSSEGYTLRYQEDELLLGFRGGMCLIICMFMRLVLLKDKQDMYVCTWSIWQYWLFDKGTLRAEWGGRNWLGQGLRS